MGRRVGASPAAFARPRLAHPGTRAFRNRASLGPILTERKARWGSILSEPRSAHLEVFSQNPRWHFGQRVGFGLKTDFQPKAYPLPSGARYVVAGQLELEQTMNS